MRRVLGHLAEAHPAVDEGWSERRAGVVGVGTVHDAQIASGDTHVAGRTLVGPRDVGSVGGVTHEWGRHGVEEQRSRGTAAAALADLCRHAGERPAGAELGQLEVEGSSGVGPSQEQHVRGDDTTTRRVTHGGHDGLAQHLAALHHRTSPIGPGHAFPGQIPGLAQIQHVDQVGGVTPRGELP